MNNNLIKMIKVMPIINITKKEHIKEYNEHTVFVRT